MRICLITGSGGLVGSESVLFFSKYFDLIIGIDNDMRKNFFGKSASVSGNIRNHSKNIENYIHYNIDIRDSKSLNKIFKKYSSDIGLIVHCAAQPSHDFAASDPYLDYSINSNGTFNILECLRKFANKSVFINCSTNKVYGDRPNYYSYKIEKTRISPRNKNLKKFGFSEQLSIDNSTHSLFGASKVSADILCQEYGKYFDLKIGIFRGGCLTGSLHKGAKLHGFLSYLVLCALNNTKYQLIGHGGKQVRDNIHSSDLINAFYQFYKKPKKGEVYNIGGGPKNNCSIIEAISLIEEISGLKVKTSEIKKPRIGDHIWWISDTRKFKQDYPQWKQKYTIKSTITDILESNQL